MIQKLLKKDLQTKKKENKFKAHKNKILKKL